MGRIILEECLPEKTSDKLLVPPVYLADNGEWMCFFVCVFILNLGVMFRVCWL